jgi:hypothetical protein
MLVEKLGAAREIWTVLGSFAGAQDDTLKTKTNTTRTKDKGVRAEVRE